MITERYKDPCQHSVLRDTPSTSSSVMWWPWSMSIYAAWFVDTVVQGGGAWYDAESETSCEGLSCNDRVRHFIPQSVSCSYFKYRKSCVWAFWPGCWCRCKVPLLCALELGCCARLAEWVLVPLLGAAALGSLGAGKLGCWCCCRGCLTVCTWELG